MSAININDIQNNVENLSRQLAEEKKRNDLLRIIPMNSPRFVNKETGEFDAQAYDSEIE